MRKRRIYTIINKVRPIYIINLRVGQKGWLYCRVADNADAEKDVILDEHVDLCHID